MELIDPDHGLQETIKDRKLINWAFDRTTLRKTMAMTRNPRMTRRRRRRSPRPRIPKRSSKRVSLCSLLNH
jgi:hypothetical protein